MNPCVVLNILAAMFQTHLDTPANQAKIQEALQFQQKQCDTYSAQEKKKAKKKDEE